MELRVLNYFLMVAREENITRAANLLHVTQPTLSRQLMHLEEELGVQLFERNSHNIRLTEEGMLLKRRAQEMINLAEKTRQELQKEDGAFTGKISIGCGELRGMEMVARTMKKFLDKYPQVKFDIFSGNADDIKERMESGILDLGLLMEPVDIGKYEFVRTGIKEEWRVVMRKDSPLAEKDEITAADLVGVPLLLSHRELVRKEVSSWFGDYADQMNVVVSHNLNYNSTVLVEQGIGVMFTLQLNVQYGDLCFRPLSPKMEVGSVLVWKKSKTFSPAVTEFIKYLKGGIK